MSIRRVLVLTTAGILTGAAGAGAQACLGFPTRDGSIAIAASYGDMDGWTEIGGDFHADVSGPGAFGFAYRTGTGEGEPSTYELRGAYDFYLLEPAICVVGGVRFMDVGSAAVSERLGVPVGLGIGKTLDTGRFATTVYAIPQYMWVREVRTGALGDEVVETSNEFTGEAGLTVGILPLFLNGAITLDTLDDEPTFRFRVGLVF
ncbi:MAG TPA: hypothetical protein VMM12_04550 [Longimicrobiales bacterium]|nr:hypothetical protein [Longimicrobiales bacterium]